MKNTAYRFLNHVCALLFGWALLFNASFAQAQSVLPIPPLTALVMDQTNTLTASEVAQLDAKLKAFEKTKGSQIGILIVPTTAPEDVFSYTQRAAETYKLGRKGVGAQRRESGDCRPCRRTRRGLRDRRMGCSRGVPVRRDL